MCISFRRYVSKLYSDFRKGTWEKELNVTEFAVATSAISRISRVRELWFQSACARIQAYCILFSIRSFLYWTRFTSRNHHPSSITVTARDQLRFLSVENARATYDVNTERSSVFLKLFQNDSFFMPNLNTELFYKLERRRDGGRARGERARRTCHGIHARYKHARRVRLINLIT